jgi:hypothetical protein
MSASCSCNKPAGPSNYTIAIYKDASEYWVLVGLFNWDRFETLLRKIKEFVRFSINPMVFLAKFQTWPKCKLAFNRVAQKMSHNSNLKYRTFFWPPDTLLKLTVFSFKYFSWLLQFHVWIHGFEVQSGEKFRYGDNC